jgi:hypothetical protein
MQAALTVIGFTGAGKGLGVGVRVLSKVAPRAAVGLECRSCAGVTGSSEAVGWLDSGRLWRILSSPLQA